MKNTKHFITITAIAAAAFAGCKPTHTEPGGGGHDDKSTVPYTIQLVEYINAELPHLHSYTHANYKNKIVMFGGRRRGLHTTTYNFGQDAANKIIYVIDKGEDVDNPTSWKVYSQYDSLTVTTNNSSVAGFVNAGQFRANNAEFFTKNNTLYVIGGILGANAASPNSPVTLPYMTAVDLPALIDAVMKQTTVPLGSIRQVNDENLAITGGETGLVGDSVYLAFGWNYNSANNGLYTHRISTMTYTDTPKDTTLAFAFNRICETCSDRWNSTSDSGNYRRRDGSMSPMVDPATGKDCFLYYAGVFKNGNTNFDTPVWIYDNKAEEQSNFHMRGNVYTCQVVSMYSKKHNASYATMLGGMTNVSFPDTAKVKQPLLLDEKNAPFFTPDPNNFTSVPFTSRFTTIRINKDHSMQQYLLPDAFPVTKAPIDFPSPAIKGITTYALPAGSWPNNGAESEILWTLGQDVMRANGAIDYDKLIEANPKGGTVGYLFGGILSRVPNDSIFSNNSNNPLIYSVASNRLFAIKVVPLSK